MRSLSVTRTANSSQTSILQWFNNVGESKHTQLQVKIKNQKLYLWNDHMELFSLDMVKGGKGDLPLALVLSFTSFTPKQLT